MPNVAVTRDARAVAVAVEVALDRRTRPPAAMHVLAREHAVHADRALRGAPCCLRRRWRNAASNGSCVASARSSTSTRVRRVACRPRRRRRRRPRVRAGPRRPALAWRAPDRRRRSAHRPVVAAAPASCPGRRIPRSRAPRSPDGCRPRVRPAPAPWPGPACAPRACTWRLMLDSATWSRSISVSSATPLRASASAAHEPTPPRPTTATRAARSRA